MSRTVVLLDVSLLLALLMDAHESHALAHKWFREVGALGWATCPITQAGFVRIASNEALSPGPCGLGEAAAALEASLQHPHHHFWPDDLMFLDAIAPFRDRVVGPRQVTDAYLLGLALHHRGRLATLDRRLQHLLPAGDASRHTVITLV